MAFSSSVIIPMQHAGFDTADPEALLGEFRQLALKRADMTEEGVQEAIEQRAEVRLQIDEPSSGNLSTRRLIDADASCLLLHHLVVMMMLHVYFSEGEAIR